MHNRIFIEEDKEFTLDEFAHLVARAVRSVASVDIDKDEVKYSRDDVFFTIVDVLGYINERTPGRFKIDQPRFQEYLIHYVPSSVEKKRSDKGFLKSKVVAALNLKEMTGELPVWATQNPEIMERIQETKNAKAETSNANVKAAQAEADESVQKAVDTALDVFHKTGEILPIVTTDMAVCRQFYETLKQEEHTHE